MTEKRSRLYEREDIDAGAVKDTYTPVESK